MRSFWKIAIPVVCGAVICGAAITWQVYKAKANERELAEEASLSRVSAEQGDAKAEFRLGDIYYYGQGVTQDYSEALHWYHKAADQGDTRALYEIGYMYDLGQGVPQDYTEALRWYRKVADQGYAKAQCGIGAMYYDGRGVPQDRAEAARWYRKAADQGLPRAQYDLGYMYYYGQGLPQERAEADRWYHKAADQGDEYAQRALGLKGAGLSIWSTISLSAMFLGCLWTLKGSLLPQESLRNRQQRALTLAGIFGLAYIGLSVFRAFGVFQSVLAVNAFYFFKNLVAGITVALLISVFGPKSAKVILGISGILFIGNNLIVILHHDFTRFVTTIRGFSSVNGLLIGMVVPLAVFLWLEAMRRAREKQAVR